MLDGARTRRCRSPALTTRRGGRRPRRADRGAVLGRDPRCGRSAAPSSARRRSTSSLLVSCSVHADHLASSRLSRRAGSSIRASGSQRHGAGVVRGKVAAQTERAATRAAALGRLARPAAQRHEAADRARGRADLAGQAAITTGPPTGEVIVLTGPPGTKPRRLASASKCSRFLLESFFRHPDLHLRVQIACAAAGPRMPWPAHPQQRRADGTVTARAAAKGLHLDRAPSATSQARRGQPRVDVAPHTSARRRTEPDRRRDSPRPPFVRGAVRLARPAAPR